MNKQNHLSEIISRLREDSVLGRFSAASISRLLPHVEAADVESGAQIACVGKPASKLIILLSGKLEGKTEKGQTFEFKDGRAGDEAIMGLTNYEISITAKEYSTVILIPRRQISEIIKDYPQVAIDVRNDYIRLLSGSSDTGNLTSFIKFSDNPESSKIWGWITAIIAPTVILFSMIISDVPIKIAYFTALLSAAACMWIFALVDEFIPPIFVISVTVALSLVPTHIALNGFGSDALLLFVGVYGLGLVLDDSGIFYRYMLWVLPRLPNGQLWPKVFLIFSGYLISPVISSGNSRISMLQPLYKEMIECLSLPKKSSTTTSFATATYSGAMLMSPMFLTSKPSNLVVIGLLPYELKEQFSSLYWFYAAGIAALIVTLGHFMADKIVFGHTKAPNFPRDLLRQQSDILGPLSAVELASIASLIFFLGGAATGTWHHLSLSQISSLMLVSLLIFGLITKASFQKRIDWPMIFFLLSLDGLTSIMNHIQFSEYLIDRMPDLVGFLRNNDVLFVVFECTIVLLIRIILPTTAGMVTSALLLVPLALPIGINAWVIGFLASLFSDMWVFSYQSSVYTQFRTKEGGASGSYEEKLFMKHNMIMNLTRLLAAFISIPYWKWLGLI